MVINKSSIFKWCNECNVPVLGKKCGCGSSEILIKISYPGDVRIVFEAESKNIDDIISKYYGSEARVKSKIILANKRGGYDKTNELIIDGIMVGVLSFDIVSRQHKFVPTARGEFYFTKRMKERVKEIPLPLSGFLKGKVFKWDKNILKRDYGIVKSAGKLLFIRKRESDYKIIDVVLNKEYCSKENSIKKMLDMNMNHLKKIESEAKIMLRSHIQKYPEMPVNVAFSGGKDSLVVLDIAESVLKNVDVYFVDTGFELAQTTEFVKSFGSKVDILKTSSDFLADFSKLGPPTKDNRWCSKRLKLDPIFNHIKKKYPEGCLTVGGKRALESFSRAKSMPEEKNPFVPCQISVYPILKWKAIDVFSYILMKKLKYNPLYDLGFDRVGCYMCPAQLEGDSLLVSKVSPELFKEWRNLLYKWAEKNNFSKKYINLGLWRWKELPKKMKELATDMNINTVSSLKKKK
ncbi:MAG: phosphoadenosine phosphosulfate reductase family protein [Candidatus Aenigmarchaeota archaeon]|nr:phosphoadenosine phosphosulfate reductase family protein [Candidatus Aenigmarchaeota archaeon]